VSIREQPSALRECVGIRAASTYRVEPARVATGDSELARSRAVGNVLDGVAMGTNHYSDFTPVAGGASLFGVDEGHQGLSADAETGLVYNRHRYLHVTLGRTR
jgi:hypothetical protein